MWQQKGKDAAVKVCMGRSGRRGWGELMGRRERRERTEPPDLMTTTLWQHCFPLIQWPQHTHTHTPDCAEWKHSRIAIT
eukprot:1161610-Pelagomonas_calceolata.AAC.4